MATISADDMMERVGNIRGKTGEQRPTTPCGDSFFSGGCSNFSSFVLCPPTQSLSPENPLSVANLGHWQVVDLSSAAIWRTMRKTRADEDSDGKEQPVTLAGRERPKNAPRVRRPKIETCVRFSWPEWTGFTAQYWIGFSGQQETNSLGKYGTTAHQERHR